MARINRVALYVYRNGVEHKLCGTVYEGPTFPSRNGAMCDKPYDHIDDPTNYTHSAPVPDDRIYFLDEHQKDMRLMVRP